MCRQLLPLSEFSPKAHRCRTCHTNYVRAHRHGGAASMRVTQAESRGLSQLMRGWPLLGERGSLLASMGRVVDWRHELRVVA
jgi:hypothetical protein